MGSNLTKEEVLNDVLNEENEEDFLKVYEKVLNSELFSNLSENEKKKKAKDLSIPDEMKKSYLSLVSYNFISVF
jgi:hypothetical protein